jgi:hypothetical protein
MQDIEYVDLPAVPTALIESIEDIINKPRKDKTFAPVNHPFQTKYVNQELEQHVQSIFPFAVYVQYQVIYDGLPIHIDKGNRLTAYNYLLQLGGDNVTTKIYNENYEVEQSETLMLHRWHRLNTSKLHGVHGISTVRVAISATPQDGCDRL